MKYLVLLLTPMAVFALNQIETHQKCINGLVYHETVVVQSNHQYLEPISVSVVQEFKYNPVYKVVTPVSCDKSK